MATASTQQLKKGFIIRLIVYVIIIACLAQGYLLLEKYHASLEQEYTWMKNDINALKGKIDTLNKKTIEFSEATGKWEALPEKERQLQGLRLTEAKEMIDALEKTYHLHITNTSFSKPKTLGASFTTETVETFLSEISLSVTALSDEHIFQFLQKMYEGFPGFIQLTSFSLIRTENIDKDVLIAVAKGETPALVKADIVFSWVDFKYIQKKENREASAGTPATEKPGDEATTTPQEQDTP